MKKLHFIPVLIILLLFNFNTISQTVDDIINKYIEAIGGMDNLNAIKTMVLTGKFGGGGFEAPAIITFKRPDKVKFVMDFQGNSMIQCYDGTTAWQTNPWTGKPDPEKMPAERTKDMKEMADIDGSLVNYKQKGFTAELIGKEDMEGSEVYKIKLTDKDNDVTYYFLDTQTYLLLKESSKRKIKEKEIEAEKFYGNYQKQGGVMMALSVEFRAKGETTGQTGTIEKVEMNVDVDDAIFKMPEGK
ncbi:MAG TPA: hypothetical protein VJ455_12015 [Ignavibacteria bacterium]|nr:hypothetical protein [Ignavibacteria bacterium]